MPKNSILQYLKNHGPVETKKHFRPEQLLESMSLKEIHELIEVPAKQQIEREIEEESAQKKATARNYAEINAALQAKGEFLQNSSNYLNAMANLHTMNWARDPTQKRQTFPSTAVYRKKLDPIYAQLGIEPPVTQRVGEPLLAAGNKPKKNRKSRKGTRRSRGRKTRKY